MDDINKLLPTGRESSHGLSRYIDSFIQRKLGNNKLPSHKRRFISCNKKCRKAIFSNSEAK
ncbi:hypothetical protein SDC9_210714 [bioreactor metagenome]|uniref:Uncharacterized protein n=1 Tax=bioreactor metagenome TaxID=1076179 RepID=A0A645JH72_9ZZZZ